MKLFFFLIIVFQSLVVISQNQNSIIGEIYDEFETPIFNAHIKIINTEYGTVTGKKGIFNFKSVPIGIYTIQATYLGYETLRRTIIIKKNEQIKLRFVLFPKNEELDNIIIKAESIKSKKEASAEAVSVIDTKEAKLKSGDLGKVLAQTQGVSIRRSGGLGDKVAFSLNGLSGDQVRFFLDGIPLEFNGYNFGISTIPVNFINRIDIYKGVVPIKYGADALGGAVDLISPKIRPGFKGSAYYQTGSFGTHRTAVSVSDLNQETGLFYGANIFYDYARNNYKVDVDVADDEGKLSSVNVPRFHDAYQGYGMNLTLGVKNKPLAKEFKVKGFFTNYTKEIQNNNVMSGLPYGEVITFRKSIGTILTYRKDFGESMFLDTSLGYNYSERQFKDISNNVYNWYGEPFIQNIIPGEINDSRFGASSATNEFIWRNNMFSRVNLTWTLKDHHTLRASIAPTLVLQVGDERLSDFNATNAKKKSLVWVNGIEYEIDALENSLKNIFFVKHYLQNVKWEDFITTSNTLLTKNENYFGIGNGLSFNISEKFSTKLTYEYAIRLPNTDELFGDGQFVAGNLELTPERSHNANLEFFFKKNRKHPSSSLNLRSNFFIRKINDLIFFVVTEDRGNSFENVAEATSIGGEFSAIWTSKSEKLSFNTNFTYQDFYNNSKDGIFAPFYKDRIPNKPYFFSNAEVKYFFKEVLKSNDKLSLFTDFRYIHNFFNSWESAGLITFKQVIPSQQIYNLGATYSSEFNNTKYALTAEIQNITNEKNFDFFGVQKPGSAFYIKLVTQF